METRPPARPDSTVAAIGLIFHIGLPMGLVMSLAGCMKTFAALSPGDMAKAASAITGGVAQALLGLELGALLAFVGWVFLLWALFSDKIRAPWLLQWGRVCMYCWLPFIPIGTVIGVCMLVYFSRHRDEFQATAGGGASPDRPRTAA